MKRLFLLLGLLVSLFAQAQQTHISGFVSDSNDGERIIGANVFLQDLSKGVATDQKGYFNLAVELPATLCISCIGYEETCLKVNQADEPLQIHLKPLTETLQSVEVSASRIERRTSFNTLTLNAKSIDQLPTLGSRPDIIKAAQQLPGIEAATEASSLMIVRGGVFQHAMAASCPPSSTSLPRKATPPS